MKIVCAGSIAYDYLMTFPGHFRDYLLPEKLDCVSLSFLVDSMVRHRGGIAPNICFTLALLGEKPYLLGTVGIDFEEYRAWLESKGVITRYVRVIPNEYTASFFATTDRVNAQLASFFPGAMGRASECSVRDVLEEKPDLVVISPTDPKAMEQYVEECRALKIPYLYDPSQQIPRSTGETLRHGVEGCKCLFVNDYEFELLQKLTGMGKDDILKTAEFIVVTCGEKGSNIYTREREYHVPIVPAKEILDPTGVGDAFRAGFLKGYSHNLDWETCGRMGALAATYCLENRGTQNHTFTPAEFLARYREHFDDQGALSSLL